MHIRSIAPLAIAVAAGTATASLTPLAFGPLGGTTPVSYFTFVTDISADGSTFAGVLNTGGQILRTPTQDYSVRGTGAIFRLNPEGTIGAGGQSGQNPQRWDLATASATSITSTDITWPGGPFALGAAYATNRDGTVFNTLAFGVSLITPTGRTSANDAFRVFGLEAFAGAWRGLSPDAPIVTILGFIPGNDTNGYRWNYQPGNIQPLEVPFGATSISLNSQNAVTYDGTISVGTASIGGSKPFWWDADGNAHAVPILGDQAVATVNTVNYTGTMLGGGVNFGALNGGQRAYAYSIITGELYDLNEIYSDAGILPDGWQLTFTQHISDDGSKIFCGALAPDGSSRVVQLDADFFIPAPGTATLIGAAGLIATRRRR